MKSALTEEISRSVLQSLILEALLLAKLDKCETLS
jgi:hypothetical protein